MVEKQLQTTEVSSRYCDLGATALFTLKQYSDALFYYNEAIRYNFTNETAHFQKILALLRLKQEDEALRTCDTLLEINPNHVKAYEQKVLILLTHPEQKQKALKVLEDAIAHFQRHSPSPSDRTALSRLIQLKDAFPSEPKVTLVNNAITQEPITVSLKNLQSSTYIVGAPGSGKTSILTHVALEMIERGESVIVLDPSGDMCHDIMRRMPQNKVEKTYYLSLTLFKFPFSLNLFSYPNPGSVGFEATNAARNQIYMAFSKIFGTGAEGIYFKGILRNLIPILLDHPTFTIFHAEAFLADARFRKQILQEIPDQRVHQFWESFNKLPDIKKQEEASPFLRRLAELLDDPVIAHHIGQKKGKLDLKRAIENKEILLIHLPLDQMAYRNAAPIIGTLLMMQIYAATFSFTTTRPGFTLLVDEFPEFLYAAGAEFKKLVELGRKYGIRQVLCHQNTGQFEREDAGPLQDTLTSSHVNIVMRTTLKDSANFAPLFAGLKQYPAEIEIELLDKLKYHKSYVVKEFWRYVVQPLQDAVDHPEIYARSVEVSEEIAEKYIEKYVDFDATDQRTIYTSLLQKIYNLLYFSMKKGVVEKELRQDFIEAYCLFSDAKTTRIIYTDNREQNQELIQAIQRKIAECKEIIAGYEEVMDKIEQGYYPDGMRDIERKWVATSQQYVHIKERLSEIKYEELPTWSRKLAEAKALPDFQWKEVEVPDESTIATIVDEVLAELIADPLTAHQSELTTDEIAKKLKGLEKRHGLAKIEGKLYEIETIDLGSPTITVKEMQTRLGDIIAQTKRKYCRGKAEIDAEIQKLQVKLTQESSKPSSTRILKKLADDIRQQSDRLDEYEGRHDF